MVSLLIEEHSFLRIESEIRSIHPDINVIVMNGDGDLRHHGEDVAVAYAKPDIAWLSLDVYLKGLMMRYVQLIQRAGSVKWMQTFGAGLDRPFYRDLFKQGMKITKSNAQAIAIAEYVISNVMALFQGTFERKLHQDAHHWKKTSFRELWKTRWLITGFGNIGQEIAKRVKGFDCEVIGVRRTPTKLPNADSMITLNELPENLPHADVIVLACSLNEETRGLADRHFFQNMKSGSIFVNIARGALVDHEALSAAIKNRAPAYALLDVFDPEPLPEESPLWELENTIITPHSSNAGSGTQHRGDLLFVENLRRFLSSEPLLNEAREEDLLI